MKQIIIYIKKYFILLMILQSFFCFNCNNQRDHKDGLEGYESLRKYDHILIKKDSLKYKYTNSTIMGEVFNIVYWGNKILMSDHNQQLYIFDSNLNFLKKIGRRGKGPGEFIYYPTPIIGSKKLMLVNTEEKKIYIYNDQFELISTLYLPKEYIYFSPNPLYINDKYIFHCSNPKIFKNKNAYNNEKSMYAFNYKFEKINYFFEWDNIYHNDKYYAYCRNHGFVFLTKAENSFFATQSASIYISHFSSDLKLIRKFGVKPKFFKNPPIEPNFRKIQKSIEAFVDFTASATYRNKIEYDKINQHLVLGYVNLAKDFFKNKSYQYGDNCVQIFDKNYDCIFDDKIPGQLAFIKNGLIYFMIEQSDKEIIFWGYELVKK